MANPSGFSDSQVSDLLNYEDYEYVQKEGPQNVTVDDINFDTYMAEPLEPSEQKCNVNLLHDESLVLTHYHPDFQQQLQMQHIPIEDEFPGDYQFEILLESPTTGKVWMYSSKLHKIFINLDCKLPLKFKWVPPLEGLWLRATMVFSHDQHRADPVKRCNNHLVPEHCSNKGIDHVNHVIRCVHNAAVYQENNGHLSVIAPLGTPPAGVDYVPMHFQFYCKNSCTSGMNRRPTEVIFTLETREGEVLGRRKLHVRVCSCPKRDKEKEEAEVNGNLSLPSSKKRKISPNKKISQTDNHVYMLPIRIIGKQNFLKTLDYVYNLMAGQAILTDQIEQYKREMDYIQELIHKYNDK